jgi:hypothetical protein
MEDVDIEFRSYDQAGNEGRMEGSRKRKRRYGREGDQKSSCFCGKEEGGVGRRSNMETPPRIEKGGAERPWWRPLTRGHRAALTHESPKRVSAG